VGTVLVVLAAVSGVLIYDEDAAATMLPRVAKEGPAHAIGS
jgi:hypothetical protein